MKLIGRHLVDIVIFQFILGLLCLYNVLGKKEISCRIFLMLAT